MKLSLADRMLRRAARLALAAPDGVLRAIARAPRTNQRGDRLDLRTQVLLELERRVIGASLPASARAARAEMARSAALAQEPAVACAVTEGTVAGRAARIYTPDQPNPPVLLFLHGGGWVVGDLDSHDSPCSRLCVESGLLVVALDYRLAPEHPFPAGLHDALAAFRELAAGGAAALGGDPRRLGLGGDSAGGNLTAAATLVLRDEGGPAPSFQVLIYPATDLYATTPSHAELGKGYYLTTELINMYKRYYAADMDSPLASPLRASSHRALPPALVAVAGFDPLRDEGALYADRLQGAGVPVARIDEGALVHGYLNMGGLIPEARAAVGRLTAAVRDLAHGTADAA